MTTSVFEPRCAASQVKKVSIISAGMIGAAWAGRYVSNGITVKIWDPDPLARQSATEMILKAWSLQHSADPDSEILKEQVVFCTALEEALLDVDFVQESAPENVELKRNLLKSIDSKLGDGVLVASSTSGFSISEIGQSTKNPHRFLVGHPYNPPYIIPFVEIVPGPLTPASAANWLSEFYSTMGMRPVVLNKEVEGFIGNRLQQAVWHEALHMLNSGEATVEQIELAFTHALGPRWALMGPFSTYSLTGGANGMKGFLTKFTNSNEDNWTRLAAPNMNEVLKEKLISETESTMATFDHDDIEDWRDRNLIKILGTLRTA